MLQWKKIGLGVAGCVILASIVVGFAIVGSELYRLAGLAGGGSEGGEGGSPAAAAPAAGGGEGPGTHAPPPSRPGRGPLQDGTGGESIFAQVLGPEGAPVAGAPVELARSANPPLEVLARGETDPDGILAFEHQSGDRYALRVSVEPYVPLTSVQVLPGDRVLFHLVEGTSLGGTVRDESTGEALPGVWVAGTTRSLASVRWNEATTTDDEGRYEFPAVPEEPLTLRFARPGYQVHSERDVVAPLGQPTTLDVTLLPGLPVTGLVVDAASGEPVSGAAISAGFGLFEHDNLATTDDRGMFTLRGVGRDKVVIRARADGYAPGKAFLDLRRETGETSIRIELEHWIVVQGVVRDLEGEPVAGADVFLERDAFLFAHRSQRLAVTDGAGGFRARLEGVEGEIRLFAEHPEYTTGYSIPLYVEPGRSLDTVEISLSHGGEIRGIVVDESGGPVEGARVALYDERPTTSPGNPAYRPEGRGGLEPPPRGKMTRSVACGPDGRFILGGIPPGRKFLRVSAEGSLSRNVAGIAIGEGTSVGPLTVVLSAGRTIAGRVTDAEGRPLAGVRVSAVRHVGEREGATGAALTGAEGDFSIENLGPGAYDLFASRAGYVRLEEHEVPAGTTGLSLALELFGGVAGSVAFVPVAESVLPRGFTVALSPSGVSPGGKPWGASKTFSASEGTFRLDSIPPGTYDLLVSAEGFLPARVAGVEVFQGQVTPGVRVVLDIGAAIRGQVLDEDGSPVAGASVFVRRVEGGAPGETGGQVLYSAASDRGGVYAITGLGEGTFEVTASAGRRTSAASTRVYLGEGVQRNLDLVMVSGGEIRLRVLDPEGTPVAGASVEALGEDGSRVVNPRGRTVSAKYPEEPQAYARALKRLDQTDVTGFLLLPSVPPGTVEIRVVREGFQSERRRIRIAPGESRVVAITLEPR